MQGAFLVSQPDNFLHVIDRADCVRGISDCDDPGSGADFLLKVGEIEGAVVFVDVRESDGYASFLKSTPG